MRRVCISLLALLSFGCQQRALMPAIALDDAMLQDPQVLAFVRQHSGASELTLGPRVFRDSHILVLEPRRSGGLERRYATGRMAKPEHRFHLLSDGQRCVVRHVDSGVTQNTNSTCRLVSESNNVGQ